MVTYSSHLALVWLDQPLLTDCVLHAVGTVLHCSFITCTSDISGIAGNDASQAQLQLLLAELKRIEGQQQLLKTAAAENKVLIVHPVKGFDLDGEDEYAEEVVAKPDPDRFIPSGLYITLVAACYCMASCYSENSFVEFRSLGFQTALSLYMPQCSSSSHCRHHSQQVNRPSLNMRLTAKLLTISKVHTQYVHSFSWLQLPYKPIGRSTGHLPRRHILTCFQRTDSSCMLA